MTGRRSGRPRVELDRIEAALTPLGGARKVILDMDERGVPLPRIAQKLEALTEVRVHGTTVRNWIKRWRTEDAAMAEAAA